MAEPVSKHTALPAISVGFLILIIGSAVYAGRWMAEKSGDHTSTTAQVERNTRRFNSYSGKDGSNTVAIDELQARLNEIEKWISVKQEVVFP